MNDNTSREKLSSVYFQYINAKENWAHLAQKNSRPGSKVTTKFDRALTKTFFNLLFLKKIFLAVYFLG